MASVKQDTTTKLLAKLRESEDGAFDSLFAYVYDELKVLARKQRWNWQGDATLNTTALVHETYLRLINQTGVTWESRTHFLCVAAKAMRHLLVDYARQQRAQKRGGDALRIDFDEETMAKENVFARYGEHPRTLLALDEALRRLEQIDPRRSQVVECRFFGRMTIKDIAAALGTSHNTVKRDWNHAQLWLYRELKRTMPKWLDAPSPAVGSETGPT